MRDQEGHHLVTEDRLQKAFVLYRQPAFGRVDRSQQGTAQAFGLASDVAAAGREAANRRDGDGVAVPPLLPAHLGSVRGVGQFRATQIRIPHDYPFMCVFRAILGKWWGALEKTRPYQEPQKSRNKTHNMPAGR